MGEKDRRAAQRVVLVAAQLGLAVTESAGRAVRDPDLVAPQSMTLLFSLDTDGPMRPTAIQELTGLSSGGVTKLVERLESKGLVARKTGVIADDRRGVLVELTRRGRSAVRSMADAIAASDGVPPLAQELADALGE